MVTSHRTLRILAAITWLSGGFVLAAKGSSLAVQLKSIDASWFCFASLLGVVAGTLKVKFLFNHFCQRNLDRIAALEAPQIWQFFRPRFFLFLALMIAAGATMSRLAMDSFPMLVFVAALDISLAIALLGSSLVFTRQRAPA